MKKKPLTASWMLLATLTLALAACEHLDDDVRTHVSGKEPLPSYITLEEVAQILSSVDLGSAQIGEVHDAVSASTGNGYDEEYTMKSLFESPGAGVGDTDVKADAAKTYDTPLRSLLSAAVNARYGTKAGGEVTAEEFLEALSSSDVQIYWPYSENWDGSAAPVITFDPEDHSEKNIGFAAAPDGSLRQVIVDEQMARERPVWVVNRNDDASFRTLEMLRREDPDWGTGGGIISVKGETVESDVKTLVLRSFHAKRNYDSWFAGASEFFVKCGAVEKFTAKTLDDLQFYSPSITDFMVVVKRHQIGKDVPFDAVLVSEWTPQLENIAFMITEDDGGSRTTWKSSAKVTVKSKSYGYDIDLPLNTSDDIVWRGQLTRRYIEKYSGDTGHFGDVDLVLELL